MTRNLFLSTKKQEVAVIQDESSNEQTLCLRLADYEGASEDEFMRYFESFTQSDFSNPQCVADLAARFRLCRERLSEEVAAAVRAHFLEYLQGFASQLSRLLTAKHNFSLSNLFDESNKSLQEHIGLAQAEFNTLNIDLSQIFWALTRDCFVSSGESLQFYSENVQLFVCYFILTLQSPQQLKYASALTRNGLLQCGIFELNEYFGLISQLQCETETQWAETTKVLCVFAESFDVEIEKLVSLCETHTEWRKYVRNAIRLIERFVMGQEIENVQRYNEILIRFCMEQLQRECENKTVAEQDALSLMHILEKCVEREQKRCQKLLGMGQFLKSIAALMSTNNKVVKRRALRLLQNVLVSADAQLIDGELQRIVVEQVHSTDRETVDEAISCVFQCKACVRLSKEDIQSACQSMLQFRDNKEFVMVNALALWEVARGLGMGEAFEESELGEVYREYERWGEEQ